MGWKKEREDFWDGFWDGYWPTVLEPKVLLYLTNMEDLMAHVLPFNLSPTSL